ncbi:MAG: hypothetical protein Q8S84_01125 [bacterium]|nr:hypothetical protein [bacterium]
MWNNIIIKIPLPATSPVFSGKDWTRTKEDVCKTVGFVQYNSIIKNTFTIFSLAFDIIACIIYIILTFKIILC